MSNSDREAQEQRNNPVGQRPQDIRSRTDVIMERDAHHLDNQQGEYRLGPGPEPGARRNHAYRQGTPDGTGRLADLGR